MGTKSMILYQPLYIDDGIDNNSGTIVRPIQMIKAFESIGYEVIYITGSTKERTEKVKKVLDCKRPAFMYIESANIPMTLSNKNHFPLAPFADIRNIKYVSKLMKVGFFYRDIYWQFPSYSSEVGVVRSFFLKLLFVLEYKALKRIADYIFVPCLTFAERLPRSKGKAVFYPLPGGCDEKVSSKFNQNVSSLNILYSGNISFDEYNIEGLLEIVEKLNTYPINLSINTNEKAFNLCYPHWSVLHKLIDSKIVTIIYSGYSETDQIKSIHNVAIIYNRIPDTILPVYMPLKLFHYIAMDLPIIAKKNSGYGEFIEEHNIGWTFNNDEELETLLAHLSLNLSEVREVALNVKKVREQNTWKERAKTVERLLR